MTRLTARGDRPVLVPQRNAEIELRRDDGVTALVQPGSETLHVLNDTALALWELCDGRTTAKEMVDAICVLFDASPRAVSDDVDRTLREFGALGLVRWTSLAPARAE